MLYLIFVTQNILCLVSMVLTGMFALSLSGEQFDALLDKDRIDNVVFLSLFFLLIGCCIDIGKYLFWSQRKRGKYFSILSLTLMFFSWLASCAFLVSSESRLIQKNQIDTGEYQALQQQIKNIQHEMIYQEQLMQKRLASIYHKQWSEGEKNAEVISVLGTSLASLTKDLSRAGETEAIQKIPVTAFFSDIAQLLGIDITMVRFAGYGFLSLLLEITTLGMISLAQLYKSEINERDRSKIEDEKAVFYSCNNEVAVAAQQSVVRLICDILSGKLPPVFRKIRDEKYGMDVNTIRQVLRSLYAVGVLKEGKRNSYELAVEVPHDAPSVSG